MGINTNHLKSFYQDSYGKQRVNYNYVDLMTRLIASSTTEEVPEDANLLYEITQMLESKRKPEIELSNNNKFDPICFEAITSLSKNILLEILHHPKNDDVVILEAISKDQAADLEVLQAILEHPNSVQFSDEVKSEINDKISTFQQSFNTHVVDVETLPQNFTASTMDFNAEKIEPSLQQQRGINFMFENMSAPGILFDPTLPLHAEQVIPMSPASSSHKVGAAKPNKYPNRIR